MHRQLTKSFYCHVKSYYERQHHKMSVLIGHSREKQWRIKAVFWPEWTLSQVTLSLSVYTQVIQRKVTSLSPTVRPAVKDRTPKIVLKSVRCLGVKSDQNNPPFFKCYPDTRWNIGVFYWDRCSVGLNSEIPDKSVCRLLGGGAFVQPQELGALQEWGDGRAGRWRRWRRRRAWPRGRRQI